jgi:hypothetical protein
MNEDWDLLSDEEKQKRADRHHIDPEAITIIKKSDKKED